MYAGQLPATPVPSLRAAEVLLQTAQTAGGCLMQAASCKLQTLQTMHRCCGKLRKVPMG